MACSVLPQASKGASPMIAVQSLVAIRSPILKAVFYDKAQMVKSCKSRSGGLSPSVT